MTKGLLFAGAVALAALTCSPALVGQALAAQVNISNVSGVWTDVDPNGAATGVGTNVIKWGTSTGSGQSMYTFNSNVPPPVSLGNGAGFDLGTFIHTNNPITGNSITGATLDVAITFTSDFFVGTQTAHSIFEFFHNETPNACAPLPVCANDIVTAFLNTGLSNVYIVGAHTYTFGITGFQVGGVNFASFSSPEGSANSAILRASFNDVEQFAVPAPVVGAGFPGVMAGMVALWGLAKRRRNRAQA